MSYNMYKEEFSSIFELMNTLKERPNNRFMRDEHSSQKISNSDWSGTTTYEEAKSLLIYGYNDPIKNIKSNLTKNKKLVSSKIYNLIPKPITANQVVGFVSNVPNTLMGLPKSMISVEKINRKKKTISIIYAIGGAAMIGTEALESAGTALVSAINLIELAGIQTRLSIGFIPTVHGRQIIFPTVNIKNFNERFSLQKICFPMVHPSMFRRIGFKYLETCPGMEEDFSCGYGRPASLEEIKTCLKEKDTYIINREWITDHGNNIEEILKYMEVC